ncbi:hypothetical protein [Paenibacillus ihuae]|uniref:hypothetical protein n=1 Tax=Paenibacillus ihuae TaxID=1232431 RepID=UPI0006D5B4CD|nr:hypothetical protein [Paenibacillus ihuae]
MSKKKLSATLAVILCSAGAFTVSAYLVPGFVNSTVVARNTPAIQGSAQPGVTGNTVPVLKVEAPAPVSTVTEDLINQMTKAEIKRIYDILNKPGNEPRISGRVMTDSEEKRSAVLSDQYVYDGMRPEQQLPLKPGQAEVYLDLENTTLYFPDRTLTDEELLQLIDWSWRELYIASSQNVTEPPLQESRKANAEALAADSVRKLFDADISKLQTKVFQDELRLDKHPTWNVHSAPYRSLTLHGQGKEYWEYNVIIDAKTGVVLDTTAINVALKRTPIDAAAASAIRKDASWINKATQVITDKQGETRRIVKAYLTDTEVNNKRGMVAVKLLLVDGSSYTAEFRYPDQALRCLIYEAADNAD